jgi:hypothetical protein
MFPGIARYALGFAGTLLSEAALHQIFLCDISWDKEGEKLKDRVAGQVPIRAH